MMYRISGIFRVGLIFAEFATSSKSLKMHTVKIRHCYKSVLRALQIGKIGLSQQLTSLPGIIFAKIAWLENILIYGIHVVWLHPDLWSDLQIKLLVRTLFLHIYHLVHFCENKVLRNRCLQCIALYVECGCLHWLEWDCTGKPRGWNTVSRTYITMPTYRPCGGWRFWQWRYKWRHYHLSTWVR